MKRNPLKLISFKSLLIFTALPATFISAQSLPDTIKCMLDCEPELIAVNSDSRSSYEQWNVTRGGLKPQISLNSTVGGRRRDRATDGLLTNSSTETLFARDIGISLRQLVYDGGLTKKLSDSDQKAYEMQRYLQMAMIEERVVDLTEVYLELFRTKEQIALANANVADHRDLLSKLKIREEGGEVKTDAELVEGRLNRALNRVDLQKIKRDEAIARFERLVCKKPDFNNIKMPSIKASECVDCSKNWNVLAAQSALESAIKEADAQTGLRVPQVYLDLGASRGEDTIGVSGSDNELSALLTMSWDIASGGSNKASQRLYKHQVERAAELLVAAKKNCEYQSKIIKTEWTSATRAQKSFVNYTNRLNSVKSDYNEQFDIGLQSLIDLLDIRNELYDAKTEEIDSRYDIVASQARLLGQQGRLVSTLLGDYVTKKYTICNTLSDDWRCIKKVDPCELEQLRPEPAKACHPLKPCPPSAKAVSLTEGKPKPFQKLFGKKAEIFKKKK